VQLLVKQDREVDFQQLVGATNQQVEVTGRPPALETARGTMGQVIEFSTGRRSLVVSLQS
jgi:hypothetical protein